MSNLKIRLFVLTAIVCGVFFLTNCSTAPTTTGNGNTAVVTNKPADSPKPAATTPASTDAPKPTDVASTDSVGVAECDEYIKKYEACLNKIAKDAPQVQPTLKSAYEQQRNAFKQAAANPQAKAMLGTQCKSAIDSAKTATAAYKCEW